MTLIGYFFQLSPPQMHGSGMYGENDEAFVGVFLMSNRSSIYAWRIRAVASKFTFSFVTSTFCASLRANGHLCSVSQVIESRR
jgi:hypothetical protein